MLTVLNKDFLFYKSSKKETVITLNQIDMDCYQKILKTRYVDNLIEDLLDPINCKQQQIKELNKLYKLNNVLDISIRLVNSKVNPSISIKKETMKLLDYLDIEIDYDLFIE